MGVRPQRLDDAFGVGIIGFSKRFVFRREKSKE